MLGREKRQRQEKEAAGPRQNPSGKQRPQQRQQQADAEEDEEDDDDEEEFPAGIECEEEYDEEDVYVMVQMPSVVQGEALFSSAVTVKVGGCEDAVFVRVRNMYY